MKLRFVTFDVFTTKRFEGNPLAIVELPSQYEKELNQKTKQLIAKEFNLSETVILHDITKDDVVPIDIFTSKAEVPFAGHPTIGSAIYVLKHKSLSAKTLLTKAGPIPISDGPDGKVAAEIPHDVHIHKTKVHSELSSTGDCPQVSIVKGMTFILVNVPDLTTLGKSSRNIRETPYKPVDLDAPWDVGFTGTFYYCDQGRNERGQRAFRTRMLGSREDPATGSASCALTCYLTLQEPAEKGAGPFEYALNQGVEMGNSSWIEIQVVRSEQGDSIQSVLLSGTAAKVTEGVIEV